MNVLHKCTLFFFLLLPTTFLIAQAAPRARSASAAATPAQADWSNPQALLTAAAAANNLDDLAQPWHLKASYEISGDTGSILDIGVFEEWHLGKYRWKQSYSSDHYKQTVYRTSEGRSFENDSGEPPWMETLIAGELVHPMTDREIRTNVAPRTRNVKAASTSLDCLTLEPQPTIGVSPLGFFPTYCFSSENPMLRMKFIYGSLQSIRNQMAEFHDVFVARDIAVVKDGKPTIRIRIESLEGLSEPQIAAVSFPSNIKSAVPDIFSSPDGVVAGKKISGTGPRYPDIAKQNRKRGVVVLVGHIGTDGRMRDLHVVLSPDDSLSEAALAAVKDWRYQPYTVRGNPIEVATTISIVYNLGP